MALAYVMRYGSSAGQAEQLLAFIPFLIAALVFWIVLYLSMTLDGFRLGWHLPDVFSRLLLAASLLIALLLASSYLARYYLPRLALIYFGVLLLLGLVMIRRIANHILRSRHTHGATRRVLIMGNGPVAREMASKIERHPEMLCKVVGFLCSADTSFDSDLPGVVDGATVVQTLGVMDLLREQRVNEVIITLAKPNSPEVVDLVAHCRAEGIGVNIVPYPYELYLSRPQFIEVGGLPVLRLQDATSNFADGIWKRSLDLTLSVILIPISIPIIAIGAVMLLGRKGGPFCGEVRCGKYGKPFRMYRFNSNRGTAVVPRYEKALQQLSITELPQLWNILRGEMSLVGPRPESPERVKHYSDWQRQRLNVKPGMTGLAQVHGLRDQHSSEDKARFDLQYILHSSPVLDVSLLLQTVWTLALRLVRVKDLRATVPNTTTTRDQKSSSLEGSLPNAHRTQPSSN
jgi:lipopolysaccharide/colanic/teichoic acid biosynthesis glycosyltransferase